MISADEFDRLVAGQFVSMKVAGGPTIEGFAARDRDDRRLIRVDGLALENDGSVSEFSLRLERLHIEAVVVLLSAPEVRYSQGTVHCVQAALWPSQ